jgi:succinyl-CoA synthetase beta subunit
MHQSQYSASNDARTSSIAAMEIEANLKPVNIRLDQKNQKLGLRMLKMKKNHPTRLKTPNFPLEN